MWCNKTKFLTLLWQNIDDNNIELGKKVINVIQYHDYVLIQCDDGCEYKGDFVVDADGAWSYIGKIL